MLSHSDAILKDSLSSSPTLFKNNALISSALVSPIFPMFKSENFSSGEMCFDSISSVTSYHMNFTDGLDSVLFAFTIASTKRQPPSVVFFRKSVITTDALNIW